MKTRTLRSVIFVTLIFCIFCTYSLYVSDVRSEELDGNQFVLQVTIFEKEGYAKKPIKLFNTVVTYNGKASGFHDKRLKLAGFFHWGTLRYVDYTGAEPVITEEPNLSISFGKTTPAYLYFADDEKKIPVLPYSKLMRSLNPTLGSKNIPTNNLKSAHVILDGIRYFDLPNGEKLFRDLEIHIKIKKLKAEK